MIYKGWIIETESDLWPIKYGYKVKYYHEDGERVFSAESYEEAKDCIDEQIERDFTDEFGCVDHWALNVMERKWRSI